MPDPKLSLFRGNTSAVNSKQRADGQLLVDTEAGTVKVDVLQNGVVNRILISGAGTGSSQSDFTETDPAVGSYIKHKPTKTSDFTDTLFVYSNTEPTTDLVDNKTEWVGSDGRVELTFEDYDDSTIAVKVGHPGDTFPTISDPTREGYTFSGWSPSLPSTIPNVDSTYTAQYTSES